MSNRTKQALEASLKKLLLEKPLDRITIQDLATDCGISRMTFYYHFQDIYDLVEWVCYEDAVKALEGKRTYETWQEGLLQIYEVVLENKPFVMNAFRCISREKIENYLYRLTYGLIRSVVEEKAKEFPVTEEEKTFIAEFYKYGFVGVMLDWIQGGMKGDYVQIVERISVTMQGNVTNSLQNFAGRRRPGHT